jgi:hypothetical protein
MALEVAESTVETDASGVEVESPALDWSLADLMP